MENAATVAVLLLLLFLCLGPAPVHANARL